MKTAKRVLAIVMAMLMMVGSVALAASAGNNPLQDRVNATPANGTLTIDKDEWGKSIVIDKNITIDLGGFKLNGLNGSPAITITDGAKVTIQNGSVISRFAQYEDTTEGIVGMIDTVLSDSPAGIVVEDGSVTLQNVRVFGSNTRIPTMEDSIATGTALVLEDGAKAELIGASLNGLYGIENKGAAANVVLKEAVIVGFYEAITGGYKVDDASEKVDAADLLGADFMANGQSLSQQTIDLATDIIIGRALFVTVKATKATAKVTIDKGLNQASISAQTIDHIYANSDCSYRLIPLRAFVEEGDVKTYFPLNEAVAINAVEGKNVQIEYRIQYILQQDYYEHVNGGYNDIAYVYNAIVEQMDVPYVLGKYDEIVDKFADLFYQVNELAGAEFAGINPVEQFIGWDAFYDLERDILALGGVTLYNTWVDKCKAADPESAGDYFYFTIDKFDGEDPMYPAATIPAYEADGDYVTSFGVLDTIDEIKDQFLAAMGESFAFDGTNWGKMAYVALDRYDDVLDLLDDVKAGIEAIQADITAILNYAASQEEQAQSDIPEGAEVPEGTEVPSLSDFIDLETLPINDLDTYIGYINDAQIAINELTSDPSVAAVMRQIDANPGLYAGYINVIGDALTNPQKYIDLDEYLDGNRVNAYFVYGPTDVETIYPADLYVKVSGAAGTVSFDNEAPALTNSEDFTAVIFDGSITMTATADNGSQFLYWQNGESKRILSTNPVLSIETGLKRYVVAVFGSVNSAEAVLTTNAGSIMWIGSAAGGTVNLANAAEPFTPGRTGSTWGPAGKKVGETYDVSGLGATGYQTGNSAFDGTGVIYDGAGYAFQISANTSNKYIITPKYGEAETHKMYFVDNGNRAGNAAVAYGKTLTYTAKGSNFSYWADSQGRPVSVLQKYKMASIVDRTVTAVYNQGTLDACVNVIKADGKNGVFSVERSVVASKGIRTAGVIYAVTYAGDDAYTKDDLKLENVDGENIMKAITTSTSNTGVYTIQVDTDLYSAGDTLTAVGFIELDDGTPVYSLPQSVVAS